jgi:hypothetical protein
MAIQKAPPCLIAECRKALRGSHDVAEQDRRQDAIDGDLRSATGNELANYIGERVDHSEGMHVAFGCQRQESCTDDVICEVTTELHRQQSVVLIVHN